MLDTSPFDGEEYIVYPQLRTDPIDRSAFQARPSDRDDHINRPFHEVHASLLDNLANYERYAGMHAGKSYARDMAVDIRDLLAHLGLDGTSNSLGSEPDRLDWSVAAGRAAFFAVMSTFWPECINADTTVEDFNGIADDSRLHGTPTLAEAMENAVEAWLVAWHPDAQEE